MGFFFIPNPSCFSLLFVVSDDKVLIDIIPMDNDKQQISLTINDDKTDEIRAIAKCKFMIMFKFLSFFLLLSYIYHLLS